jgi:hypothetical protein
MSTNIFSGGLFNDDVSNPDYIPTIDRVTNAWFGKDIEGSGRILI